MRRFFGNENLPFSFTGSVLLHLVILTLIVTLYRPEPQIIGRMTGNIILADNASFYPNPDYRARDTQAQRSSPAGKSGATLPRDDAQPGDIPADTKTTAGSTAADTRTPVERLSDFLKGTDDDKSLFGDGDTGRGTTGEKGVQNTPGIQWDGALRGYPVSAEKPVYPASLEGRGVAGTVLVSVKVSPDGRVFSPMVLKSSGYPEFDRNALAAARTYRFRAVHSDRIDTGTITIQFVPQ